MTEDARPSLGRLVGWLVGAVVVGWAIVYNILRLGGDSPEASWQESLIIGGLAGAAVFAIAYLIMRRTGFARRAETVPGPGELDDAQRDAARVAAFAVAGFGVVSLAMGVVLAIDFISVAGDRWLWTSLILGGWNLVAGLWAADELMRLRALDLGGVDSAVLVSAMSSVLAGVGLARELFPVGQVILIVVAGIAGAAGGLVAWRATGARWAPFGSIVAVLVAAGSLVLALVS